MRLFPLLLLLCSFCIPTCLPGSAWATTPYVPEELKPWVNWILESHPDINCPLNKQNAKSPACVWISRLNIDVDSQLNFVMDVRLWSKAAVALPGNSQLRPLAVKVNGAAVPVLGTNKPHVQLDSGRYQITGSINWTRRPTAIPVPPQFGLLGLVIDGAPIAQPLVRNGNLVLSQRQTNVAPRDADRLTLDLYRLFSDDYPLRMTTQINLNVSGRPRLETLGRALLKDFAVTNFQSTLPARINREGDLEIQVTAGQHQIQFDARALTPPTTINMERRGAPWPEQEVWGFAPDRNLRLVNITGAPGTDLSQVNWPFDADAEGFLVTAAQPLTLTENQRGNPQPSPDTISIRRDLWVNFAGDGYVIRDALNANIQEAKRLAASYALGRIEIDGSPELVNTVAGSEPGIEVQRGQYQIESVSAVTGDELLANGWLLNATSLAATLHLPPGWRLMWARGVDNAPGAWLERWSLWNVFVLLLAVVLAYRFLRPVFAGIILIGFLCLLPTHAGIAVCWLIATAAVAVSGRFTEGRLAVSGRTLTWIWLVITSLLTLELAVSAAQQTFYPQLQAQGSSMVVDTGDFRFEDELMEPPAETRSSVSPMSKSQDIEEVVVTGSKVTPESYTQKYRDGVLIQTGPGLPQWQGNTTRLRWSGPVSANQTMSLTLASPVLVRIGHALTAVVSILVMALLILSMLPLASLRSRMPAVLTRLLPSVALILISLPLVPQAATPSPEILQQLEQRLTRPAVCFPDCTSVEKMVISIDADEATVTLTTHAHTLAAMDLPSSSTWGARSVLIDGKPADLSRQGSRLQAAIAPGIHQVQMVGSVQQVERFELQLPQIPGQISLDASAEWQVSGVVDGRAVGGAVSFERRLKSNAATEQKNLKQANALPFVEVQRSLHFGLDWQVTTRIVRMAPTVGSFTVEVPVLPGESILEGSQNAEAGVVKVVFGPRQRTQQYASVLERNSPLVLNAPESTDRRESWSLHSTNLWHISTTGIPPVQRDDTTGTAFRPRNGEALEIQLTPTEAIPGPTVTVEKVQHRVQPGARIATHILNFGLRASQGGTYTLELPPASNDLTSVTINGRSVPIPLTDNQLALPVLPGSSNYNVTWTSAQPLGVKHSVTPPVFSTPTSNITTEIEFPRNRWVLLLGGPTMGPAMLYWGVLLVVLLLATVIARIPGVALTRTDALLLAAGLSLCNLGATLLVALWLLLLAFRPRLLDSMRSNATKNLLQLATLLITVTTLVALVSSVPQALLSSPDMRIQGNGSSAYFYSWFTDRAAGELPAPWVLSLPMWLYRAAMLGWSLWLAFALIRWVSAAWTTVKDTPLWHKNTPLPTAGTEDSKEQ